MRRYAGNGNFRQPSFRDDGNGYRRNAGRGANMTQPAWQSRSRNGAGDGNFGSFASSDGNFGGGGNFRQDGPPTGGVPVSIHVIASVRKVKFTNELSFEG